MDTPENKPDDKSAALVSNLRRIKDIVNGLPYGRIARAVRISYGHPPEADIVLLEHHLTEVLDELVFEAGLGDRQALESLRNAGLRIASECRRLALQVVDANTGNGQDEAYDPFTPIPELPITDVEDAAKALSGLTEFGDAALREALTALRKKPSPEPPVSFGDVIDEPQTTMTGTNDNQPTPVELEVAHHNVELPPAEETAKAIEQLRASRGVPGEKKEDPVEAIFQHLIGRRVIRELTTEVRRLVGSSTHWPLAAPATTRNRSESMGDYLNQIGLGRDSALVEALNDRDYGHGTNIGHTLRIYEKLEEVRIAATQYPQERRESLVRSLEETQAARRRTSGSQRAKPAANGKASSSSVGLSETSDWTYWCLLAANLPEISSNKGVIERWLEASMEYLSAEVCGNDFESLPWPTVSLEENISGRTRKTLIKNKIRVGLKAIAGTESE